MVGGGGGGVAFLDEPMNTRPKELYDHNLLNIYCTIILKGAGAEDAGTVVKGTSLVQSHKNSLIYSIHS